MPFGLWARMDHRNHVLDGGPVVLKNVANQSVKIYFSSNNRKLQCNKCYSTWRASRKALHSLRLTAWRKKTTQILIHQKKERDRKRNSEKGNQFRNAICYNWFCGLCLCVCVYFCLCVCVVCVFMFLFHLLFLLTLLLPLWWNKDEYNFGCVIASDRLFDSRGGFSGSSYLVKTWPRSSV